VSQLPNRITSPPWWQLIRWIADPLKFQNLCYQKYGDIFTIHLGGLGSYVIIGNPQMIQEIFSQDKQFDVGRANALAEPLVGKNSLMLVDGDQVSVNFFNASERTSATHLFNPFQDILTHELWSVRQEDNDLNGLSHRI